MDNITVVIFTPKNDKNIKDCLQSAKLLTENVILVYPTSNFVETVRESGINQAKTDWVLILDADERITKELAKEIHVIMTLSEAKWKNLAKPGTVRNLAKRKNAAFGLDSSVPFDKLRVPQDDIVGAYKLPRKNIFGKARWLRHGGWWPDYQIRLINKKFFVNWPKRIHSTPKINVETGYLKSPLLHYFHGDLEKMVEKTVVFETVESDLLYKAGREVTTATFFRKYFAELWRRMFKNLGCFDGTIGVIESIYQAFSKTITYLFLYEKRNQGRTL